MFGNLFVKIFGFIGGVISVIFPVFGSNIVQYQSTSTPETSTKTSLATTNVSIATTSKKETPKLATTSTVKTSITTKNTIASDLPAVVKTPTPSPTQPSIPFEQINTLARGSLVNILCSTKSGGPFASASGSGVIISSNGVILTNAHIAQYFLLKDFNGQKDYVSCVIRTGSPAYPTYKAELVYISPTWVKENSKVLVESNPQGTGEHDYALLKVTSKPDDSPVSGSIPYLPVNIGENLNDSDNTLLASYPAGFLGGVTIEKNLYPSSAIAQIKKIFTFATDTIDVISVPGTVISQKGSSGGIVTNDRGQLIGIITTSSDDATTGARDLRAITTAYINRDLIANASTDLKTILENSQSTSDTFNQTIAGTLTKILTDSILGK
jgi:hypothetical protein